MFKIKIEKNINLIQFNNKTILKFILIISYLGIFLMKLQISFKCYNSNVLRKIMNLNDFYHEIKNKNKK